jgi:hypothetical protein
LPDDPRIRYIATGAPLRSIGAMRNEACQLARGEIVAHWDDDDWYGPQRLTRQVEGIRSGEASDISGIPVLLSASIPDEIAGTPDAQRVYDYVTALVRSLLGAGAPLVFGGHPTITPLVHRAAKALGECKPPISLYQLERFRGQEPPETADTAIFDDVHWVGDPNLDIDADLANLRTPMTAQARAAVFVGGKTKGFSGKTPGIRDEYERFRARHPDNPVYLVGHLGGETAKLIAETAAGKDLERNSLAPQARVEVHESDDENIVAALIVRDLQRLGPNRSGT